MMARKIVVFPRGRRLRPAQKRELDAQIRNTTRLLGRALRELTRPEHNLKKLLEVTLGVMLGAAQLRLSVQAALEQGHRRPQD